MMKEPEIRACAYCGELFFPKQARTQLCSQRCRNSFNYVPARKNKTNCIGCGEQFIANNANQIFCSVACRTESKKDVYDKICTFCSTEFKTCRTRQIFCSEECRKNYRRSSEEYKIIHREASKKHYRKQGVKERRREVDCARRSNPELRETILSQKRKYKRTKRNAEEMQKAQLLALQILSCEPEEN